jgi:protease I
MRLKGKKVAILLEQDFQDAEVIYPYYRLKEEGAEALLVAAGGADSYKGKYGYPMKVHAAAAGARAEDFDAVIVPGGWAPDFIRRSKPALALIRGAFDRGATVAGICHAGWALLSAGVVRGRECTSFSAIRDDLENAGARWRDAEVVVDGNLVTSRMPDDLPAFMRAVIENIATPR